MNYKEEKKQIKERLINLMKDKNSESNEFVNEFYEIKEDISKLAEGRAIELNMVYHDGSADIISKKVMEVGLYEDMLFRVCSHVHCYMSNETEEEEL